MDRWAIEMPTTAMRLKLKMQVLKSDLPDIREVFEAATPTRMATRRTRR